MKDLFSIGEVCKIKDVTRKALRVYHEKGILIPKYIDESTGYRYYSAKQFIHIDIIKFSRSIGTSIKELQEIFSNTENLSDFLEKKKIEAQKTINEMNQIISYIDIVSNRLQESTKFSDKKDLIIENIEERYLLISPCEEVGDTSELIEFSNIDKERIARKINHTFENGALYSINQNEEIVSKYVFYIIDEKNYISNDINFYKLPKGRYISIICNKYNEESQKRKLIDYLKEYSIKCDKVIEIDLYSNIFDITSYTSKLQAYLGDN